VNHPEISSTVLDADRARYRAMVTFDIDALERIFADDLIYMHSTGSVDSKSSLMEGLSKRKFSFKSAETADTTVRTYGDTAILNGKVRMLVEVAGTDHHAFSGFTTVWNRREGEWRLVHWQSTPLPKA